ncbi:hypothetical protein, partial [Bacillus sp. V5-8f]|uniref:hypothetical protein n=1 Tax=Bacillus sp. V5-8f TaxID=2053044 RepID=UPI000CB90129
LDFLDELAATIDITDQPELKEKKVDPTEEMYLEDINLDFLDGVDDKEKRRVTRFSRNVTGRTGGNDL